MVAPATRDTDYPVNPWTASEDKKRLAQHFFDVRTKQVQDIVPRGLPLPEHVKPFAEYMARRAGKPATNRDIVKAYLMTMASIQRGAVNAALLRKTWPTPNGPEGSGMIRPEDAVGQLLLTPTGQHYLNAAERGQLDIQSAMVLARAFRRFGLEDQFTKALDEAPVLARHGDAFRKRLRGSRQDWYSFVNKSIPGVSYSKAGFIAALLGRGDIATADKRQINFWTCPPNSWDMEKRECAFPAVWKRRRSGQEIPGQFESLRELIDPVYLERLNQRMRALKVTMPARYKPFYTHLAHHTFWDAIDRTKTTHADVIRAMELAGR
jgi:hypothetical protein